MKLDGMPVFATLKGALQFHSSRAQVLAENVANADTPGFRPSDIAGGDVARALEETGRLQTASSSGGARSNTTMARTHSAHFTDAGSTGDAPAWRAKEAGDSERTYDGNEVVMEEQIARVSENRASYEAAVSLYQKSLGLLRMAARTPSG